VNQKPLYERFAFIARGSIVLDAACKTLYNNVMIKSFKDKRAQQVFEGFYVKELPHDIQKRARRKLVQLHSAPSLNTLSIMPGNNLEKLRGNRKGQLSFRINNQWRIVFSWHNGDAYDVEIIDYH
jgi:proteic killer suppression protein